MDTFIEIEAKYLLNEEDFKRILEDFKKGNMKYKVQTNYYFDTQDFLLQKNKLMFRVRYDGVYYEGTLKLPNGNEEKIEINETVSQEEFINLCAGRGIYEGAVQSKLKELGYNVFDLELITSLETKRHSCLYENGEIFFDENEYSETTDYEIEFEVSSNIDDANKTVLELLKQYNVTEYKQAISKRERAVKKALSLR